MSHRLSRMGMRYSQSTTPICDDGEDNHKGSVSNIIYELQKKNLKNLCCKGHLCHVEPQADGLALLEKSVELPAVKQIIQVTPQSFQNFLRKLHLLIVPACQSMGAPIQQHLQR